MLKRLVGTTSVFAAVLAGGVLTAPSASAWSYQCSWTRPANGGGAACSAPAGNQFRAVIECRSGFNNRIVRAYGPWRNATGANWSIAFCASGDAFTGLIFIEGRQA